MKTTQKKAAKPLTYAQEILTVLILDNIPPFDHNAVYKTVNADRTLMSQMQMMAVAFFKEAGIKEPDWNIEDGFGGALIGEESEWKAMYGHLETFEDFNECVNDLFNVLC